MSTYADVWESIPAAIPRHRAPIARAANGKLDYKTVRAEALKALEIPVQVDGGRTRRPLAEPPK